MRLPAIFLGAIVGVEVCGCNFVRTCERDEGCGEGAVCENRLCVRVSGEADGGTDFEQDGGPDKIDAGSTLTGAGAFTVRTALAFRTEYGFDVRLDDEAFDCDNALQNLALVDEYLKIRLNAPEGLTPGMVLEDRDVFSPDASHTGSLVQWVIIKFDMTRNSAGYRIEIVSLDASALAMRFYADFLSNGFDPTSSRTDVIEGDIMATICSPQ